MTLDLKGSGLSLEVTLPRRKAAKATGGAGTFTLASAQREGCRA